MEYTVMDIKVTVDKDSNIEFHWVSEYGAGDGFDADCVAEMHRCIDAYLLPVIEKKLGIKLVKGTALK